MVVTFQISHSCSTKIHDYVRKSRNHNCIYQIPTIQWFSLRILGFLIGPVVVNRTILLHPLALFSETSPRNEVIAAVTAPRKISTAVVRWSSSMAGANGLAWEGCTQWWPWDVFRKHALTFWKGCPWFFVWPHHLVVFMDIYDICLYCHISW